MCSPSRQDVMSSSPGDEGPSEFIGMETHTGMVTMQCFYQREGKSNCKVPQVISHPFYPSSGSLSLS